MRKSSVFFCCCASLLAVLAVLLVHATWTVTRNRPGLEQKAMLARYLHLTDLCLFTDARYTRHMSQADLNAPFQEHPAALEHFPSGSLVPPPPMLRRRP